MEKSGLGLALRTARQRCGLNEFEAAERAGVTRAWISSVELDRIRKPDQEKLKRVAKVYGVNPTTFLRLAGIDVDGVDVPDRDLSDLFLELFVYLKKFQKTDDDGSGKAEIRKAVRIAMKELSTV